MRGKADCTRLVSKLSVAFTGRDTDGLPAPRVPVFEGVSCRGSNVAMVDISLVKSPADGLRRGFRRQAITLIIVRFATSVPSAQIKRVYNYQVDDLI